MSRRTTALPTAVCYRLDGTWSCVRDGVTQPCGDCSGCWQVAALRRAESRVEARCPMCVSIRLLDGYGRLPRHLGLENEEHDPTTRKVCQGSGNTVMETQYLVAVRRARMIEELAKDL